MSKLLTVLSAADVEQTGSLSREDFTSVLTGFSLFRVKEPESILSLVRAAENELGTKEDEALIYQNLFMQVCDGLAILVNTIFSATYFFKILTLLVFDAVVLS